MRWSVLHRTAGAYSMLSVCTSVKWTNNHVYDFAMHHDTCNIYILKCKAIVHLRPTNTIFPQTSVVNDI